MISENKKKHTSHIKQTFYEIKMSILFQMFTINNIHTVQYLHIRYCYRTAFAEPSKYYNYGFFTIKTLLLTTFPYWPNPNFRFLVCYICINSIN